MRIFIKLRAETPVSLPFPRCSYYSDLSASIYKTIGECNPALSSEVHDGEKYSNRIKLFAFSPFYSENMVVQKADKEKNIDGSRIFNDIVSFVVCSPIPEFVDSFRNGLKKTKGLRIGSQYLDVYDIDICRPPSFYNRMTWEPIASASIVTTWKRDKTDKTTRCVLPNEPFDGKTCEMLLKDGIIHKWKRLCEINPDLASLWTGISKKDLYSLVLDNSINVKILLDAYPHTPKTRFNYIKKNPIKSWKYPVEITAPIFIQQLIWSSGLGRMNSMGYGVVRQWNQYKKQETK